jgi:hypothetical protein
MCRVDSVLDSAFVEAPILQVLIEELIFEERGESFPSPYSIRGRFSWLRVRLGVVRIGRYGIANSIRRRSALEEAGMEVRTSTASRITAAWR